MKRKRTMSADHAAAIRAMHALHRRTSRRKAQLEEPVTLEGRGLRDIRRISVAALELAGNATFVRQSVDHTEIPAIDRIDHAARSMSHILSLAQEIEGRAEHVDSELRALWGRIQSLSRSKLMWERRARKSAK